MKHRRKFHNPIQLQPSLPEMDRHVNHETMHIVDKYPPRKPVRNRPADDIEARIVAERERILAEAIRLGEKALVRQLTQGTPQPAGRRTKTPKKRRPDSECNGES